MKAWLAVANSRSSVVFTMILCRFPVYPELETRNSILLPSSCPSQVACLIHARLSLINFLPLIVFAKYEDELVKSDLMLPIPV